MTATKYPIEMKLRAFELKKKGRALTKIAEQLIIEFPDPAKHLLANRAGPEMPINHWFYNRAYLNFRANNNINISEIKSKKEPNNKIVLDDKDLGIMEHFPLTSYNSLPTSDKFTELSQSIPELLAEKREELIRIKKQIHQLEVMSQVFDENETEPELEATGSD